MSLRLFILVYFYELKTLNDLHRPYYGLEKGYEGIRISSLASPNLEYKNSQRKYTKAQNYINM